jgi:hypothetical protein
MATLARDPNNPQPDFPGGAVDLARLKREIDIRLVAKLLDFEINAQNLTTCFRPQNHRNDDAHPSLHFLPRKNCAFCFACGDRYAMNVIDFVMAVFASRKQPCKLPDVIRWFRNEFNVPLLKGRPSGLTRGRPYRVGIGDELEPLIRSGLFATLSAKAQGILFVIRSLRDDKNRARLPYATLRRFTGIGSDTTIKDATGELEAIHIVKIEKGRTAGLEPENVYVYTPNDPRLIQSIQDTAEKNRDAIAAAVDYYRQQKLAKRRKAKAASIS